MVDHLGPLALKHLGQLGGTDIDLIETRLGIEVLLAAGRQVIDDDHVVAGGQHGVDHVRTNKTSSTRYQNLHNLLNTSPYGPSGRCHCTSLHMFAIGRLGSAMRSRLKPPRGISRRLGRPEPPEWSGGSTADRARCCNCGYRTCRDARVPRRIRLSGPIPATAPSGRAAPSSRFIAHCPYWVSSGGEMMRGPTRLISPLSTFRSWGSSSRL